MNEREAIAAADAVYQAEQGLRRAAETVDELSEVVASSLRVLDEASSDAFYAHQEDRRDFYMESAGEHLRRLRHRASLMDELGQDLTRHLSATRGALERAGSELTLPESGETAGDVRELRKQVDVLSEVVALAQPVAAQLTRHAQLAADAAIATEALTLLDERVHQTGHEVARAGEDVSIMRSVIESAQNRARTSASLAGSLTYTAGHSTSPAPPPSSPTQLGHGIAI